jgi:DNA-binding MarR family transcriptional regulator
MAAPSWLGADELRVFHAFSRSARAVQDQLDRELQRDVGLPRAYFEILWCLYQTPGHALRMSEVADSVESTRSMTTYLVARLEKMGHLRREHYAEDRRGWFAVLTSEGAHAAQRAAPRYACSVRENLLGLLSPEQSHQLAAIGETLLGKLAPGA